MRARAVLGSVLAAFGILVIGWEAGTVHATSPIAARPPSGASSGAGGAGAATGGSTGAAATSSSSSSSGAVADGSYTGAVASTPYGDVQVSVSISGGRIADVTALKLTDRDGRSVQISNRAAPVLRQEVLAAQTAKVQMVSGATFTSDAYLGSLQSALDQAGFSS